MDANKKVAPASRLYTHTILDSKEEQEVRYEKVAGNLINIIGGKSDKEINDTLMLATGKDTKSHEDICLGFLVLILTESENAAKHYRNLTLVVRDGFQYVIHELTKLISEKYLKFKEEVRKQLLWLIREMIKNQVSSIDGLCWTLMRQIAGGDLSQKNLWLADTLMDVYIENRAWLEKFNFLLLSVVYTYLRIIEDHAHANLTALRTKEVNFVVSLIRDRFSEVVNIGRDFVRLLQNIARIPEVEELWNAMLHNPSSLAPNFTGITQIMTTRTSRRFLQSRITPDMEKKLVYLTSQVRFGSHKRYQDWFQKSYLTGMESQTLRCDLIRFIVGVIHPTNEMLCTDIIPRWAVIGWLLTTCTNPVAASNAKLALFYDWLFFDPEKDNIMNIEPAILVMHHSIRPHPAITATLLDFLCRIINNFYPAGVDQVRNGIYSSLRKIVDKKVVPSLSPLFDNQRLDKELRSMLKEKFGAFLSKEESERMDPSMMDKDQDIIHIDTDGGPTFSDDEDDDVTPLPMTSSSSSLPLPSQTPTSTSQQQPDEINSSVGVGVMSVTSNNSIVTTNNTSTGVSNSSLVNTTKNSSLSTSTVPIASAHQPKVSTGGVSLGGSGGGSIGPAVGYNGPGSVGGGAGPPPFVGGGIPPYATATPSIPGAGAQLPSTKPSEVSGLGSVGVGGTFDNRSGNNGISSNNALDSHNMGGSGKLRGYQDTMTTTNNGGSQRGYQDSLSTNSSVQHNSTQRSVQHQDSPTTGTNSTQQNAANGERDDDVSQSILDKLEELGDERDNNERGCEIMDQLVQILMQEQVYGDEAKQVAEKLSDILRNQFEGRIFPEVPSPDNIEDSVGQPLFVIFRTLCEISDIDPNRQPILAVLAELYGLQPRLGYYLLYFLKTYNKLDSKSKANLYKDLCEAIDDNNSLDICLVNDMRQCQEDDVSLFVFLVPDIYTHFQKAAIGNEDLLYLVVSCVDGRQIQTLVSHIIARDLIMFRKDSFQPVISISLTWETFEQYALWQLLNSHDIPIDCILPLIPRLSYEQHSEALTHFMHILRREKPSSELIKHLMSRDPCSRDMFVNCVLSSWLAGQHDDIRKLGELISTQLGKQASPAGGKRKRNTNTNKSSNSLGPLAEMTLGHLDILRQNCKNYDLFNLRSIQHALQTVRSLCTDFQKKKFGDLFALADSESEEEEDSNPRQKSSKSTRMGKSPVKSAGGGKKSGSSGGGTTSSGANNRNSESSELTESEEEEIPVKGKGRNKGGGGGGKAQRKRTNKVSYREMESTENDSDEDDIKKTPKKRKKMSSESD